MRRPPRRVGPASPRAYGIGRRGPLPRRSPASRRTPGHAPPPPPPTTPRLDPAACVGESAIVIGDVVIGAESSIWFGAVVRGDIESIRIGARSNVQDNATLHVVGGKFGTTLGDGVTVGHNAIVHGCVV